MNGLSEFSNALSRGTNLLRFPRIVFVRGSVIFGFILNLIVFYPGFMSPDSLNQFQQASTNTYSDWHPPIMAWVWRQLNYVFVPPAGLLFLQIFLLWWAVYSLALEYIDSKTKIAILLSLPLFPSILCISGVLWKDVQMAFTLLAVFALSFVKHRRSTTLISILLLLYAISLRSNAILVLPPLIVLFVILRYRLSSKLKIIFLALIISTGFFAASIFIVQNLTHPIKSNLASVSLQDDLAFFSLIENRSLIPGVSLSSIKTCALATPGGSPMYVIDVCISSLENREANSPLIYTSSLRTVWLESIWRHPLDYVSFRLYAFNVQLRSPGVPPRYYWNEGIVDNEFGFKPLDGPLTKIVRSCINFLGANFDVFFKPFFWAWLNLVLTLLLWCRKSSQRRNVLIFFNLSGLSYLSSYFFFTGSDFRYSYWTTVITIFVSVIALFEYGSSLFNVAEKRRILLQVLIVLISIALFGWTSIFDIDLESLIK